MDAERVTSEPHIEDAGAPQPFEAGEDPVVFGLTLRTRRMGADHYEARVVEAWNARGESSDPAVARRRAVCALRDLIADRVLEEPPGVERYPELESDLHLLVEMTPGGSSAEVDVEVTDYGWAAFTSALGPSRPMAQFAAHARETLGVDEAGVRIRASAFNKWCFGYNLVLISSVGLGLPVIWTLIPATGDERAALLRLMRTLYRLRPDFPMRVLIGDGLYANSRELAETLYARYGVHHCFAEHQIVDEKLPWAKTGGTPTCCGGRPMKLHKYDDVWDQRRRRSQNPPLRPGAYAPSNNLRMRWVCPNGRCQNQTTYAKRDWRLYAYLPRRGSHPNVALRYALLDRRNSVESLFALTKHLGPGSGWPSRMRFGGDIEAKWIVSLALMLHTARRLVHQSGQYTCALADARSLGLVDDSAPPQANGNPTAAQERAYEKSLSLAVGAEAPASWDPAVPTAIDEDYLLPPLEGFSDEPDRGESRSSQS